MNLLCNIRFCFQLKECSSKRETKTPTEIDVTPEPRKRILTVDVPEFVPNSQMFLFKDNSARKTLGSVKPAEPSSDHELWYSHPLSPEEPTTPSFTPTNYCNNSVSKVTNLQCF